MKNHSGFTLIEVLIVMALFSIILTAIYETFITQNHSYFVQEEVATVQQNSRAAMLRMEKDIRMAGYNPKSTAPAGILVADASTLQFTADLNGDGDVADTNENITYALMTTTWNTTALGRSTDGGATYDAVADNIQTLNFVYLGTNENVLTFPVTTTAVMQVEVSIIARAGKTDQYYTDRNKYLNQQNQIILDMSAAPDHYRRRLVSSHIKCRNLLLN